LPCSLTCPGCGAELLDAGYPDSTGIRWCTPEAARIADYSHGQRELRRRLKSLRARVEMNLRFGGHRA